MIIKTDTKDKEAVEWVCAELGYQPRFFTMETNPLMVQVEVLWDGRELPAGLAYHFGRMVQMKVDDIIYRKEKRIF